MSQISIFVPGSLLSNSVVSDFSKFRDTINREAMWSTSSERLLQPPNRTMHFWERQWRLCLLNQEEAGSESGNGARRGAPWSCEDNEGLCTIFAGVSEPPSVICQSTASFFAEGNCSLLNGKSQEEITALLESAPQGKVHFWSDSCLLWCTLSTKGSKNPSKKLAQICRGLLAFSTQHLNRQPSPDELILKRVIFPELFQ